MASQLLINEPPLQVLPTLAHKIGLNEAIVLQQVHYWLNPQFNKNLFEGRYWVRNTYEKWQKQFPFLSERTLRRTIMSLEKSGLLISYMGGHLKQIKFYTIHYERLNELTFARTGLSTLAKSELSLVREENTPSIPEPAENQGSDPSGQIGHLIWLNWPFHLAKMTTSSGQIGHLSYKENTLKYKNTLPSPLTPPPIFLPEQREEEEEEKIKVELENANRNSEPVQGFSASESQSHEADRKKTNIEHPSRRENPIFSEMIEIWNQTVQAKLNPGQKVWLTQERRVLLQQFLDQVSFTQIPQEQLGAWRNYCLLIAKSRFLAGENATGFKASLDWAFTPSKAYKILEGAIYDNPKFSPQNKTQSQASQRPWEAFEEELAKTASGPYRQEWIQISKNLAKILGQSKYKSWFTKVSLQELTETKAVFCIKGAIPKDYIESHFSAEIRCAVQALYPKVTQIDLQLAPHEKADVARQGASE